MSGFLRCAVPAFLSELFLQNILNLFQYSTENKCRKIGFRCPKTGCRTAVDHHFGCKKRQIGASDASFWVAICRILQPNLWHIVGQFAVYCLQWNHLADDYLAQCVNCQVFTKIAHFCDICERVPMRLQIFKSCMGCFLNFPDKLECSNRALHEKYEPTFFR